MAETSSIFVFRVCSVGKGPRDDELLLLFIIMAETLTVMSTIELLVYRDSWSASISTNIKTNMFDVSSPGESMNKRKWLIVFGSSS